MFEKLSNSKEKEKNCKEKHVKIKLIRLMCEENRTLRNINDNIELETFPSYSTLCFVLMILASIPPFQQEKVAP